MLPNPRRDKMRSRSKLFIFSLLIILLSVNLSSCQSIKTFGELTSEEKLEDFEYLFKTISENHPFLTVNKNVNDVDWLGEKENFKSNIEKATEDETFVKEINNIIAKLNDGYTYVVDKKTFPSLYVSHYNHGNEFEAWLDILEDKVVLNRYDIGKRRLEELRNFDPKEFRGEGSSAAVNYKADILVPDQIAYLGIYNMSQDNIEGDGEAIREFLKDVKDYEKLLIDIRLRKRAIGLRQDSNNYWMKNLVSPLIKEEVITENYYLIRGDQVKDFYDSGGRDLKAIDELNKSIIDSLPVGILDEFDYYGIITRNVKPENPIDFQGEIFLLTDDVAYDGFERFAAFCKDSNFASLVGKATRGYGLDLEPIFFALPNSGLVISSSAALILNGDGSIHRQEGVIPHIKLDFPPSEDYEKDQLIQYIINEL